MKRVKLRSTAVLALALMLVLGLAFYVIRFGVSGEKWASSRINRGVYSGSTVAVGTVTDRNGEILSEVSEGKRVFSPSEKTRRATLHAVGDTAGNIGTSALKALATRLIGYNPVTGTYSLDGGGGTAKLSIDATLNLAAYDALNGRSGAVVVINYKTGEILCNLSSPTFDPNNPSEVDLDSPRYEGVYLNRVLSASYTPGSSFKLVTAAAAIERIPGISTRKFECTGSFEVGEGVVTCTSKHGSIGFDDALAHSCNVAFAQLALELGGQTLQDYAKAYGFIDPLKIDGIYTAAGNYTVAEPDSFELAWSGAGQSKSLCSPVAMARFAAAIANGGSASKLTSEARSALRVAVSTERVLSSATAKKLGDMMEYNVEETYGADNFPGLALHAKSGTAEVGNGAEPHAWFVGYIENEDYPLAFAVIVENGGGGSSVAGGVANKVLQAAVKG